MSTHDPETEALHEQLHEIDEALLQLATERDWPPHLTCLAMVRAAGMIARQSTPPESLPRVSRALSTLLDDTLLHRTEGPVQ
ncbi:hypothetical protein [Thioalkalivibrio sp. ALE11]|uniref:hypothetical protein n=1 Tax=Thioalkalivibrio sp. ALE11 TaxID=1265494 RepID=UPI00036773E2|nr:hypothetical protein [Thioalkalivibrio sp. ALE11]